jgi:hypothetical protein
VHLFVDVIVNASASQFERASVVEEAVIVAVLPLIPATAAEHLGKAVATIASGQHEHRRIYSIAFYVTRCCSA